MYYRKGDLWLCFWYKAFKICLVLQKRWLFTLFLVKSFLRFAMYYVVVLQKGDSSFWFWYKAWRFALYVLQYIQACAFLLFASGTQGVLDSCWALWQSDKRRDEREKVASHFVFGMKLWGLPRTTENVTRHFLFGIKLLGLPCTRSDIFKHVLTYFSAVCIRNTSVCWTRAEYWKLKISKSHTCPCRPTGSLTWR